MAITTGLLARLTESADAAASVARDKASAAVGSETFVTANAHRERCLDRYINLSTRLARIER